MKKAIFFCWLFTMAMFSMANSSVPETICPVPTNVVKALSSSGSVSYNWDDCSGGCSGYQVRYVRLSDNYTSSWISTSVSNYNFTELQAGNYEFHFRTVCGSEASSIVIIEDVVWY